MTAAIEAPARQDTCRAGVPVVLTRQQSAVLNAIRTLTSHHGIPPTLREAGAVCGLSASAVRRAVRQLDRGGWLQWTPGKARGLAVTTPDVGHVDVLAARTVLAQQRARLLGLAKGEHRVALHPGLVWGLRALDAVAAALDSEEAS